LDAKSTPQGVIIASEFTLSDRGPTRDHLIPALGGDLPDGHVDPAQLEVSIDQHAAKKSQPVRMDCFREFECAIKTIIGRDDPWIGVDALISISRPPCPRTSILPRDSRMSALPRIL